MPKSRFEVFGFPKRLTEDDISVAHLGGQPVQVITRLVGFGAAPINVWPADGRLVLNNGFHRMVALRMAGITRVPWLSSTRRIRKFEFPAQILGLSREYLLHDPRPVQVRDFFDPSLIAELRLKARSKMLRLAWGPEEGMVPE